MTPTEALAQALMFVPEPYEVRIGVGTGTGEGSYILGDPQPGSFTLEQRAESVIAALPEGWRLVGPLPQPMAPIERFEYPCTEGLEGHHFAHARCLREAGLLR